MRPVERFASTTPWHKPYGRAAEGVGPYKITLHHSTSVQASPVSDLAFARVRATLPKGEGLGAVRIVS